MKRLSMIAALILINSTAAFAADEPKPTRPPVAETHPACGPDAKTCQKVVDDLTNQLARMTLAYQAVRTQRDQARTGADDAQVQTFIQQQADAAAKLPGGPPKP